MTLETRVLERAPAAWDALVREDPHATPAHRPAIWDALAAAVSGGAPRLVAVERGGALVGGMPVVLERRAGFHWIRALPHLLSGAPLAADGARDAVERACGVALAGLARACGAVGGEWTLYRPEGGDDEPAAFAAVPGTTTWVETAVVDLAGGLDAARARAGRRMRQYARNAPAGLAFGEEPEALEEVYALHLRQARGWPGYRPVPLEVSRRLVEGRDAEGAPLARLFALRDHGRIAAATLFLDHSRELFAWWSGIHPRARNRHLFPLLLWHAIEWAAGAGRARVNLGGSAGRASLVAFKQALGAADARIPVRWLAPAGGGLAGWVAALQARRRARRPRGTA